MQTQECWVLGAGCWVYACRVRAYRALDACRARSARRPVPLADAFVVLALFLAVGARARASELSEDLKARRARVVERLGADAMLVLWSAPSQRYSLDIDYEYRQDSNLYYLTGLMQEDSILVLMPGNAGKREILFVKERNPVREHWTGRVLSTEDAKARTGIDTVLTIS